MKKGEKRESPNTQRGSEQERKKSRFFAVAAVFVIICTSFLISLAATQNKGTTLDDEDLNYDVRTETVSGERGRIFDRNGVLLVGNTTKYKLIFEYGSMAYSVGETNEALLKCLNTLVSTGNSSKRVSDHFIFTGTYPNMQFKKEVYDTETNIGYYYARFLKNYSLPEHSTAEDIIKFFTNRYKLSEEKYSPQQITELIRIRYDMLRVGFGAYQEYTIASDIDSSVDKEMALIKQLQEQKIEGATIIKQEGRVYPYGEYAAHILGTTGKITAENVSDYAGYPLDAVVGISGCEYAFESYLRGTDGKKVTKYDKDGKLVAEYYDPAPVVGNDIYLTIDINLQIAAEDSLEAEIERLDYSESGAATAVDPNTGEVYVIASYPKFSDSAFNRALSGTYAPGSTYKVGSALSALERKNIYSDTMFYCNGTYPELGGPTCLGKHGWVDAHEAIRVSCNVYFYYVGHKFGLEDITDYTAQLGLGVSTGIELGEADGIVATKDYCEENDLSWREFDDATGAIGQSYHSYTPLQLSVYMSTIVNHGTRYSAHLLKCVKTRSEEVLFETEAEIANTVEFSDETYELLIDAMEAVVDTNLSAYFSGIGVDIGGKTGTAEMGTYDNALFSGFGPVENPTITASCVIEHGVAGANASKIVADIFEEYFNPEEPEDENSESE